MKRFWIVCGILGILVGLYCVSSVLFADTGETLPVLSIPSSNIRVANLPIISQYTPDKYIADDLSREQQIELMRECAEDALIVYYRCSYSRRPSRDEGIARMLQMFWKYRTRGR